MSKYEMKTECCNKEVLLTSGHPVHFNPFNNVIQCHICGAVYRPAKLKQTAAYHHSKPKMVGGEKQ